MLQIEVKAFNELSLEELYHLLQLRSEVFCLEQNCVYQDLDGKDMKAYHMMGKKNGQLIAYTRVFKPGDYFEEASIGRVAVKKSERKYGYGLDIMRASIDCIEKTFRTTSIRISAQSYLDRFYGSLGFIKEGEEYLEDGIPHIQMARRSKAESQKV